MKLLFTKTLLAALPAGLILAASAAVAAPVALTDAQMDQVVAGAIFSFSSSTTTTTTQNYQGNDATQPTDKPAGPGVWSAETTVTVITTLELDCVGNSVNSCFAPDNVATGGLNPNTQVLSNTSNTSTTVGNLTRTW
jgi:ABC-type uncharacterized transport system permease subunit